MEKGSVFGIIAHQGDFSLHEEILKRLGLTTMRILTDDDLDKVKALVIPGGESTTLGKFFDKLDLWDRLTARINDGMPVFGTCAGLIILAKNVNTNNGQRSLDVIDVDVKRNAYGRQVDSFESDIESSLFGDKPLKGIFIRAPRITRIGSDVEVLASLDNDAVLVRSGNILGATFHPELSGDKRVHAFFARMSENK